MATAGARSDFVSRLRQTTTGFLKDYDELVSLRRQWDWLYNTELKDPEPDPDKPEEKPDPGDFKGDNEGLTRVEIEAVFSSLDAVKALLDAGHGTNLQKVRL